MSLEIVERNAEKINLRALAVALLVNVACLIFNCT